jgi:hypothetical protein
VQIHQVECDSTREITVYSGNRHFPAYIGNTQVGEVRLCDRFIHLLIFFDASKEIKSGFFRRRVFIVRIARANFQSNVCCDDGGVVTHRFEENNNNAFFLSNSRFNFRSVD